MNKVRPDPSQVTMAFRALRLYRCPDGCEFVFNPRDGFPIGEELELRGELLITCRHGSVLRCKEGVLRPSLAWYILAAVMGFESGMIVALMSTRGLLW